VLSVLLPQIYKCKISIVCNLEAPSSLSVRAQFFGTSQDSYNSGGPQFAEGDVELSGAGPRRFLAALGVGFLVEVGTSCLSLPHHHVSVCLSTAPISGLGPTLTLSLTLPQVEGFL
jgi:hypothetical protein